MAPIRPFKIDIPQHKLDRLKQKLDLTDLPGDLEGAGDEYGAPLPEVKRLLAYWKDSFDWRKEEAKLNELPQFKTELETESCGIVDLHFVHQKSKVKNAIPLLMSHGWPGSFYELSKLIRNLSDSKDGPAFHIVAPSLANFGFSSRVTKKGFGFADQAKLFHKLMQNLGYTNYVTHGGDWGFMITRALCVLYPDNVKAFHSNWMFAGLPAFSSDPLHFTTSMLKFAAAVPGIGGFLQTWLPSLSYTEQEMKNFSYAKDWQQGSGRGYFSILSTKPQTVAYSLTDSPAGLLGFLFEKLVAWTDDYPWTDDEVLTWISIYYFSDAGAGASGMIYKEGTKQASPGGVMTMTKLQGWTNVPLGFSLFPKEISNMPQSWATKLGKIVFINSHKKGGHFAAFEQPDAIAADLKTMFGKGGAAYGVVKGLDGY